MEKYREIEKSIIKKFRKTIWSKFVKAIKEYNLIEPGDKIAVCISGGKDSMLLAKCMQELQRHGQFKYRLEFILMDPGYDKDSLDLIEENIKKMNIPLTVFKTDIFDVVKKHGVNDPCYLCARMRRGHLYNKAHEMGCNKIALAHHYDDVIETTMLNLLFNGKIATMMPKLKSDNFKGMELIRPMYMIKEDAINLWVKYNELRFIDCACPISICQDDSKRLAIKEKIKDLKELHPDADKNIFKATSNVNLNMSIGYFKDKKYHHFLDDYDKMP